jgi:hypothetical protein
MSSVWHLGVVHLMDMTSSGGMPIFSKQYKGIKPGSLSLASVNRANSANRYCGCALICREEAVAESVVVNSFFPFF